MKLSFCLSIAFPLFVLAACSTSPLGRKRIDFIPDSQMNAMGAQSFQQLQSQANIDRDPRVNAYVQCVAVPITQATKDEIQVEKWDIKVFKDDKTINAFALPGGEIGVYSGIFQVAKTPAQLATVIAHEVGHVVAKHGGERVSESLATQGGLTVIDAFLKGTASPGVSSAIVGALGLGAQFGVMLPFSRTQESEADLLGQQLMAKAGFDPQESVTLWQNMISATQGKEPPALMSDHPASSARVEALQGNLPQTTPLYQQAKANGLNPQCGSPPH